MAIASYTTDLVTINILDSDATPVAVGEPTGSTAGTTIATETDHYVVGTACISKIFNATGIGGLGFQNGTAVTVPADGAVYMWTNFLAPNAINVQAQGGMQILVGNTLANYKRFYVYGDDTVPYGGWQCYAVNPANTASATQGTPNGIWQYFGMAANVQAAVARGYPLAWDAVRAGRGSIIAIDGDLANGYANFDAMATKNDLNVTGDFNRWGIFSYNLGTYNLQGRLSLGSATTPVDFRDSNRQIFIKNTEFVTSAFNTIEILNAASVVQWTGVGIQSLGTVSRGRLIVTDNASVNIDSCSFTDMGTFSFLSNSTVIGTTFRRCDIVDINLSTISNCIFDDTNDTLGALRVDSIEEMSLVSGCTFTNNTTYGINLAATTTTTKSYSFSNITFSGNAIDVYVAQPSGSVTITITGGGTTPTFISAGATVTVVNTKFKKFTGLPEGTEIRVRQGSFTLAHSQDVTGGFYQYDYTPSDKPAKVVFGLPGYIFESVDIILNSTDQEIQVVYSPDPSYTIA
jgi:hypothetical protein